MLNIKLIGIGQGCYVIDSYKSHLSKKFPVAFTLDFSEPGATNTVPAGAREHDTSHSSPSSKNISAVTEIRKNVDFKI